MILKGLAVVWGANNVTFTAGILSATNGAQTQSSRLSRTSDKADLKNGLGDVVGQGYANRKKTFGLTVVPSGIIAGTNTIAAAKTSLDAWCPASGTTITSVDADGNVADGNFNLITATINRTNDGAATVDLEMENFDDNDVTTLIS